MFNLQLPFTSSHFARKPDEVIWSFVTNLTVRDDPELMKGPGMVLPQYLQEKLSWVISR